MNDKQQFKFNCNQASATQQLLDTTDKNLRNVALLQPHINYSTLASAFCPANTLIAVINS